MIPVVEGKIVGATVCVNVRKLADAGVDRGRPVMIVGIETAIDLTAGVLAGFHSMFT